MVQLLKNDGADVSEAGDGQWELAMAWAYNNGHYTTRHLLVSSLKLAVGWIKRYHFNILLM